MTDLFVDHFFGNQQRQQRPDDEDQRPTIPIDLAPKSSEDFDDLSAHANFDTENSEIEVADGEYELLENSDDRLTPDFSQSFAA